MNNGFLIEEVDPGHDAISEFLFGFNADVPQDRASKFGKEALDQVEPRPVSWGESEFETVSWLLC
jgi:hypothetical protein